jgi:cysteine-rich repeat protein
MKPARRAALLVSLGLAACPLATRASQQPRYLPPTAALELASGARVRASRALRWQRLPAARTGSALPGSLGDIRAHELDGAIVARDDATGLPSSLVLRPLVTVGASHDAAAAAAFARQVLARHLDLLAPGAAPADFVLSVNDVAGAERTVLFAQHHRGLPVLGAEVSFRFKADRLFLVTSTALPAITAEPPATPVSSATARASAAAWLRSSGWPAALATAVGEPLVLPLVGDAHVLGYRTVVPVTVESYAPRARYLVYVDAADGAPVARRQTLHFAEGTLLFDAPVQHAGAERQNSPAAFLDLTVGGQAGVTDENGLVSFADGAPVELDFGASGAHFHVANSAGANATQSLMLDPDGTAVWDASSDPSVDAQVSAFIQATRARRRGMELAGSGGWFQAALPINVNIDDVCNAFFDGASLNFYAASSSCQNTALVADVVFHEYGHAFHYHALFGSYGQFEEALSEGLSDYFAGTITGSSAIGRGFFHDESPLRDFDPPDREYVWPDDIQADAHGTGQILAGALWDLRKALIAKLGQAAGLARMDQLHYPTVRNAVDIPSTYLEVLAADDDDGDLQNGTPNGCEIDQVFAAHGLRPMTLEATPPAIEPPNLDGYDVSVTVASVVGGCPFSTVQSVELRWRLRSSPEQVGTVPMTGGPEQFVGTLPAAPAGSVIEYQIVAQFGDGSEVGLPANRADPYYQLYVGDVVPLYCTDFETDPALEGWTHGLTSGSAQEGADDWQWGEPQGTSQNGDPAAAYGGTNVYGNDLGAGDYNGLYQSDKVNYTLGPTVDVRGFFDVRLQYRRWLNVEDGHFDHATIYANGVPLWANLDSQQGDQSNTHHTDREWRFHDVPLGSAVHDGTVAVKFELASDGGLELGGWTLDDLCIVGVPFGPPVESSCGNGRIDGGEECDDGNRTDGDGCDSHCRLEDAGVLLVPAGGCACRTAGLTGAPAERRGPLGAASTLGLVGLAGLLRARRRRERRRAPGS